MIIEKVNKKSKQVVSKQRVSDYGEVFTSDREVNAMLNLVKPETERIESRFLEPACGTGNFLAEVLARKLKIVKSRYAASQLEFERNSVLAVSSIYGIDILQDSVVNCRKRLSNIFEETYVQLFQETEKRECHNAIQYILEKNIVHGNALIMKTIGDPPRPIIFAEWSPVNGNMLKRRDYIMSFLVENHYQTRLFSDQGDLADINEPIKEYPLTHFLEVSQND